MILRKIFLPVFFPSFLMLSVLGRVLAQERGSVQFVITDTVEAKQLFLEMKELVKVRNWKDAESKGKIAQEIYEQVLGTESKEVADTWYQLGVINYYQGDYDASIVAWENSLNIRLKLFGKDNLDVARSYHNLGNSYNYKGETDKAIEYLQKALNVFLNFYNINSAEVAQTYNSLGNSYFYKGEYFDAVDLYQKVLRIRINVFGEENAEVARSYHNIGDCYNFMGEYAKSIEYLQKSLKILLKTIGAEHPDIANSYISIGNSYALKGDHDRAIEYYHKSLGIILKTLGNNHPYTAAPYHVLGNSYASKGEYERALDCYQKALDILIKTLGPEHSQVASSLQSIGICYENKNEPDKALEYYHKALALYLKTLGNEHSGVALCYNNLAYSLILKKDYDEAFEYSKMALDIFIKSFGKEHPDIARSYNNIVYSLILRGDYNKAIEYCQKSIESCGYQENTFLMVNSMEQLMWSMKLLTQAFQKIYETTKDPANLFQSHKYALQALDALNYQQSTFTGKGSKSFWKSKNYSVYEQAIEVTLEKAKADKDEALNYDAFTYAEKSKSSLLQSQIKETDALAFSNIPDSLIQREHDLRIDLTWREKQRQEKLNSGLEETDSTVLAFSSKIFDLRQQYDDLKTRFEKDYPEYYRLKYDLSTAGLSYVQDTLLSHNQTLLEYFVGDSSIFIFTVGKGKYDVVEVKDDSLEYWVKQLQNGLYGYYAKQRLEQTDELYRQTMLQYIEAAQKLYTKLIAPVQSQLTNELVIIPDGVLGYVPFEALLQAQPRQQANFATYPFLVKDYRISYCYSATLLREMKEKRHKQEPTKSFVAFAPFYEGSYEKAKSTMDIRFDTLANGQDTIILSDVVTRKEFNALPASGEETATAAKLWKGDYFLNTDATKQLFNDLAGDYRIVHLSTHGIADARVGDYSYLAFAEQKDSIENEFLYVRDLYNTQLNAGLVVLSACETAQGELQRGEGIISLARAFAYAGAKSIVTTLWTVDDSASKDLTKEFYLQLKKGKTKDAALQAAKLKLANGKDAKRQHPFFWAGFIGVGDMSAMK